MNVFISMAAFALAASITPGPVNIVGLSSGARYGFWPSMRHVMGATLGFILLLVLAGFGVHEVLLRLPYMVQVIQWGGAAFLLYMAFKLARDDGQLTISEASQRPSMLQGAIIQWLNPKAWLAAVAGMALFVADGDARLIWQFAAIYFVVCYLSLACWAYVGTFLRQYLDNPKGMRLFNRVMALLLVGCSASLFAL
ncbi:threonine/homoserine/homoserine lactone efflux protein [Pseudomonas sp. JUb42]|jgi:threonine/homoserine/homoserine lactone efflux protein|uniref:LysE family translocator n=1 Tax=Pseudomonas sp. JUb42 TaxID=2940611 RepID=UPI002169E5DF|nr:LysE family translocator [Pseudomonas sp. JUb42]MCS3471939.1 threonine/homoserine/homoserine lactone efflux protein [Pseudomonas sp. JUb42]